MRRILGIDPGKDVALCLLSEDPDENHIHRVRANDKGLDEEALRNRIEAMAPTEAFVERVGVMPGQGIVSGATFMVSWGLIRGILVGLDIPYTLVSPVSWKKEVLVGYDMGPEIPKGGARKDVAALRRKRKEAQKGSAVAWVGKQFPGFQLVQPGCRKPDHNLAEAACIAAYGAMKRGWFHAPAA